MGRLLRKGASGEQEADSDCRTFKWTVSKVLEEPEPEAKLVKPPPVATAPVQTFTPKARLEKCQCVNAMNCSSMVLVSRKQCCEKRLFESCNVRNKDNRINRQKSRSQIRNPPRTRR